MKFVEVARPVSTLLHTKNEQASELSERDVYPCH